MAAGIDDTRWTDEADIVIVGLGGAGISAALEALDAGASVIAIDRFSGGGATAARQLTHTRRFLICIYNKLEPKLLIFLRKSKI